HSPSSAATAQSKAEREQHLHHPRDDAQVPAASGSRGGSGERHGGPMLHRQQPPVLHTPATRYPRFTSKPGEQQRAPGAQSLSMLHAVLAGSTQSPGWRQAMLN